MSGWNRLQQQQQKYNNAIFKEAFMKGNILKRVVSSVPVVFLLLEEEAKKEAVQGNNWYLAYRERNKYSGELRWFTKLKEKMSEEG